MALPVALFVLCLCAFLAIQAGKNKQQIANPPGSPPPPPNAVDAARQRVEQNPQDAQAHYELAIALSEEKQPDAAMDEYRVALDLAGENYDFYMDMGRDLAGRGFWPQAAMAYMRLAQIHPPPLPYEMGDALHESLYEASATPEIFNLIPLDDIAAVDPTLAGVVRSRYELFNEGPVRAQARIAVVLERNEENSDARLVQAEIFIRTGAVDRARATLEGLLGEANLPDWIRVRAQSMFDSIQP